jgi:hypothetical protein
MCSKCEYFYPRIPVYPSTKQSLMGKIERDGYRYGVAPPIPCNGCRLLQARQASGGISHRNLQRMFLIRSYMCLVYCSIQWCV